MKFGVLIDETGASDRSRQSSFSSFLVKRDHELRKRAFHQFYEEFQDHQFTLAASLSYSVKADVFRARARNYPSALEASLFPDDVPVAVYDGLIQSVRANLEPLFRYFDLRRRVLGLPRAASLRHLRPARSGDRDSDSLSTKRSKWSWTRSRRSERNTSRRWRKVCASAGAIVTKRKANAVAPFPPAVTSAPPYILMNYKQDVFADVYTLAHEAGHSMHTWFAQNSQLFQDYDYPIFLAEVASTFNEELLTHYLLKTTNDPKMRAYIINRADR